MMCLSVISLWYRITHLRFCNKKWVLFVPSPVFGALYPLPPQFLRFGSLRSGKFLGTNNSVEWTAWNTSGKGSQSSPTACRDAVAKAHWRTTSKLLQDSSLPGNHVPRQGTLMYSNERQDGSFQTQSWKITLKKFLLNWNNISRIWREVKWRLYKSQS